MSLRLPSRYEDLDDAFKGRLKANAPLIAVVKRAFASMEINGGIRFLPIFGDSGCGKSSAALELGTHLPDLYVEKLDRAAIEGTQPLADAVAAIKHRARGRPIVAVVDQYEESVARRSDVPTAFVEALSLLDRGDDKDLRALFVWLTTDLGFQGMLASATSRNKRLLAQADFTIQGMSKSEWPEVIEETFRFHNQGRALSDYELIDTDLQDISYSQKTIGDAIEATGDRLGSYATQLHDLSTYQVVMLWPVTDGLRITRIQQFSDPRQGYKLDWSARYRQLNSSDQQQLPLKDLNRARLYFDIRLVPIAAADLHPLCQDLSDTNVKLGKSYLEQFQNTHFFSLLSGTWDPDRYAPLRERESKRATRAREWYPTVTSQPTKLGNRIAQCLRASGLNADYEKDITSKYSTVRADILVERTPVSPPNVIVEMKAYSPENTMPSTICQAVLTTLRRHAQFAGFLNR